MFVIAWFTWRIFRHYVRNPGGLRNHYVAFLQNIHLRAGMLVHDSEWEIGWGHNLNNGRGVLQKRWGGHKISLSFFRGGSQNYAHPFDRGGHKISRCKFAQFLRAPPCRHLGYVPWFDTGHFTHMAEITCPYGTMPLNPSSNTVDRLLILITWLCRVQIYSLPSKSLCLPVVACFIVMCPCSSIRTFHGFNRPLIMQQHILF